MTRHQTREFGDDVIESAIALIETYTRPGPMVDDAIALLVGLREDERAAHTVAVVESRPPDRPLLTIVMIEGRGIWIELAGALVEHGCDVIASRLAQLGGLDFVVAVVDARRVTSFDEVGCACLLQFVEPIAQVGGTVHIVDPSGRLRRLVEPWPPGFVHTPEPPTGNWWR